MPVKFIYHKYKMMGVFFPSLRLFCPPLNRAGSACEAQRPQQRQDSAVTAGWGMFMYLKQSPFHQQSLIYFKHLNSTCRYCKVPKAQSSCRKINPEKVNVDKDTTYKYLSRNFTNKVIVKVKIIDLKSFLSSCTSRWSESQGRHRGAARSWFWVSPWAEVPGK